METFYLKNDRGVALFVNPMLFPQRIHDLEDHLCDLLWVTFIFNATPFLICSVYSNPMSQANKLESTLNNIDKATIYAKRHGLKNIMLLGDFNFRNKIWADSVTNKYGKLLEDYIGKNNLAYIIS